MKSCQLSAVGETRDALRQSLVITDSYVVTLDKKYKKKTIIRKSDKRMLELYEAGAEIFKQGGLVNWAHFGTRLGFFDDPAEAIDIAKEMIECFNKREDFEKSSYMKKQLDSLEENLKQ